MREWTIGRLRGKFCVVWRDGEGRRHRYTLAAKDARRAELEAPGVYAIVTRPRGKDVGTLWHGYLADKRGRAVTETMEHTWKALRDRFANMSADAITVADCRAHGERRRQQGIRDGTIHTELGHLRMVLKWAEKHKLIERAPYIERPPKPKSRNAYLTRLQAFGLRHAAHVAHVRLFIVLAQATGARSAALLGLTWDRIDFERGQIDLRDPTMTQPHKGRAIVPMNRDARAALLEARNGALTPYVIEWAGRRVKSIKRGLQKAATKAALGKVTPHMLRHTAAVHMAEAGISIEEIAQYLGHSDANVTRKVYARFSPNHLRGPASVLEYSDLGSLAPKRKHG